MITPLQIDNEPGLIERLQAEPDSAEAFLIIEEINSLRRLAEKPFPEEERGGV